MEKLFKGSFVKPEKKLKEETPEFKDTVKKAETEWKPQLDNAVNYWKNEVLFQIENMEDRTKDERILKATQQDLNDLATRIAEKILNDDQVWAEVNEAILDYIKKDEFMQGADFKEDCNKVNEAPEEDKRTGHTEGNRLPELK